VAIQTPSLPICEIPHQQDFFRGRCVQSKRLVLEDSSLFCHSSVSFPVVGSFPPTAANIKQDISTGCSQAFDKRKFVPIGKRKEWTLATSRPAPDQSLSLLEHDNAVIKSDFLHVVGRTK
jgi:hypothetical protein